MMVDHSTWFVTGWVMIVIPIVFGLMDTIKKDKNKIETATILVSIYFLLALTFLVW